MLVFLLENYDKLRFGPSAGDCGKGNDPSQTDAADGLKGLSRHRDKIPAGIKNSQQEFMKRSAVFIAGI